MKYVLTDYTETVYDIYREKYVILHRIRALREFGDVKAGDLGGYIEDEFNLSVHDCNCWVYDHSKVYGGARIDGDAIIKNDSCVCGDAVIYNHAVIDNSFVTENAFVSGYARVLDNSSVYGDAKVYGDALIYENSRVAGNVKIHGKSKIHGGIIIDNVGEVEDVEICNNETMNKYLPELKKEVSESMKNVNSVLSNNVEIKNMNDMVKDNYGSLNKVLEALYGQGPYTAYQVEYAMDVYRNRDTSDEEEVDNDKSITIQVYIDIVSRGTASIELNSYQYYQYDIDDICKRVQNMFNKKELAIDWADDTVARLKVLDTKTGNWSNTVSFDPNHPNNN